MEKHEAEVRETMTKLEKAGYRLNPKKCEFFKKNRMGRSQKRPTRDTTPAGQIGCDKKTNIPKNEKRIKIISGGISILVKVY